MNEEALRALVREAVARHLGGDPQAGALPGAPHPPSLASPASFYRYKLPDAGGPCLIEPGVRCDHCGYCQSHGH